MRGGFSEKQMRWMMDNQALVSFGITGKKLTVSLFDKKGIPESYFLSKKNRLIKMGEKR